MLTEESVQMSQSYDKGRLLEGKVSLITGAAKGIGKAEVEAFAAAGAIIFANDIHQDELNETVSAVNNRHGAGTVTALPFDVANLDDCKAAVLHIHKKHSRLDVLVNNAGLMKDALIGTITPDLINTIYGANVFGSIHLLQLCAKIMMRNRSGSIINTSSIVGITGNPGQLVYSSTKGAIIAMTRTAAKELAPRGIRVNAIAPGMIDTDMMNSIGPKFLQKHIDNIPLGRLGRPEEIAAAAVFLASDMASYITGHTLIVDGSVLV